MRSPAPWRQALLLAALLTFGAEARAQDVAPVAAGPPGVPAAKLPARLQDPAVIEAFFDGLIGAHLRDHDIAGGTVAVVGDGRVLFAKGYGFADVEARRRVHAEETLFRIGSISKLFAWTAIMQLLEAGRLSLDDDVNDHLDGVRVPDAFDEPVRIRHLLTHTPGFEDQVIGLFGRDPDSLRPLSDILAAEMPARVRPPGEVASYSNHGTGIAGAIVENVSGLSWDDYVEQRILEPLGMSHTTFRQPFPAALEAVASKGYRHAGGFVEEGFEFVPLAPVGAAGSSAADMARFMLAHLQLGSLDGATILQPETARRMQSDLFRHVDGVRASAHGFYEMSSNGERVIGHGGDTLWFHSEMALLPERGVGMFVSYNSAGGGGATGDVYEQFMDAFFTVDDPPAVAASADGFADRAARLAGTYRSARYSHRTLAKVAAMGGIEVSVTDDGALRTSATGDVRWLEVGPLTFRAEHDERTIAFRERDGEVTYLFLGWVPVVAFERVGLAGSPDLHGAIALIGGLILGAAAVLWPVAAYLRRRHDVTLAPPRRLPGAARPVAWVAAAALLLFALGLAGLASDPNQIVFGGSTFLAGVLTLPLVAAPFAVAAVYQGFQMWRQREGDLVARIGYALVCLALTAVYWQLWYWNLLGYRY